MVTTNFPDGVSNVSDTASLGTYLVPDPSRVNQLFTDFDTYLPSDWTITGTPGTIALGTTGSDGGVITVTNGAVDNNSTFVQGANAFLGEVNKRLWFKTRLKLNEVIQADFVAGLYVTTADPVTALPTDGIFFFKDDGDTNLDFHVRNGGTSTTSIVSTSAFVADTYVELAFYFDEDTSRVLVFVNGSRVASVASTNFPVSDLMRASFGVQNGEAVAKVLTVDYILAAKER